MDAATTRGTCCINVDVDPLDTYTTLKDAGATGGKAEDLLRTGLRRFMDLFASHGIRATFFMVGRSLADPETRRLVQEIAELGHEVANHSQNHFLAFGRLPSAERRAEILVAHRALEDASGRQVVGFRAPGWNIGSDAIRDLINAGYAYDSSVHPTLMAPVTRVAKRFLAVDDAGSKHLMGEWRTMMAPTRPYRPSANNVSRRGNLPILEIPITVLPLIRLPFYGTWMMNFGRPYLEAGLATLWRHRFLNLELHMIELLDYEADGLGVLDRQGRMRAHPGVAVDLQRKRGLLDRLLRKVRHRCVLTTLREHAEVLSESRPLLCDC